MENVYEKLKNMSKEQLEEAYNFFLINDDDKYEDYYITQYMCYFTKEQKNNLISSRIDRKLIIVHLLPFVMLTPFISSLVDRFIEKQDLNASVLLPFISKKDKEKLENYCKENNIVLNKNNINITFE